MQLQIYKIQNKSVWNLIQIQSEIPSMGDFHLHDLLENFSLNCEKLLQCRWNSLSSMIPGAEKHQCMHKH